MDTVIFKIDKKLKEKAQKKCKEMGITFSFFLRESTKALINGTMEAKLIIRDIKNNSYK